MERENGKVKHYLRSNWIRIGLIFFVTILVCLVAFTYFKVTTDARLAYREAKNVRLAFQLINIE